VSRPGAGEKTITKKLWGREEKKEKTKTESPEAGNKHQIQGPGSEEAVQMAKTKQKRMESGPCPQSQEMDSEPWEGVEPGRYKEWGVTPLKWAQIQKTVVGCPKLIKKKKQQRKTSEYNPNKDLKNSRSGGPSNGVFCSKKGFVKKEKTEAGTCGETIFGKGGGGGVGTSTRKRWGAQGSHRGGGNRRKEVQRLLKGGENRCGGR